jgi:endonuclease/exonuclease/phosphatase family metal-dependent hydrolase
MLSAMPLLPGAAKAAVAAAAAAAAAQKRNTHRILSANIRVALPDDAKKGVGWNDRKDICLQIIRQKKPDIICLQEVLRVQNEDMKRAFRDFMSFGFEGPEMDACPGDEYRGIAKNPILFSGKRYEYVSSGSYWLSETPLAAGSKSWDTARARHCNWMRLKDKSTGKDFRVVNTHLDHLSGTARSRQIQVIMEECGQYAADFPQLLSGDFNTTASSEVIKTIRSHTWTDTYAALHGEADPGATAHAFLGENNPKKGKGRIDFIFSRGAVEAVASEIVKDTVNDRYPSDHYFIFADIILQ